MNSNQLTYYAWPVDNFESLLSPLSSHPDSSTSAASFAVGAVLSSSSHLNSPGPIVAPQKLHRWWCLDLLGFSVQSSLTLPNSSTPKASLLMVYILVELQSQLLPWQCLGPIWKLSRGLKLGKWNHDRIINNGMALTYLELPTSSRQCCDHCEDSCEDGWWLEQHTFGLASMGGQWDICKKWQCSIKIWQIVSLPNDDIPFDNSKPALFINVPYSQ